MCAPTNLVKEKLASHEKKIYISSMKAKRGRGQPPKGDKALTGKVDFRVTAREKTNLLKMAKSAGRSLSEFIRGKLGLPVAKKE